MIPTKLGSVLVSSALLHTGGWDEVIMVALGLLIAWAVIAFTGRKNEEEADGPSEGGDR